MTETEQEDKLLPYVAMTNRQLVQVIVTGVFIGLGVWILSFVLETYALKPALCYGEAASRCALAGQYADAVASILMAGVGLFALVKLQIFRPLLVALAAVISLWQLPELIGLLPPYGVALACALLYALAYLCFAWISRLRFFVPTVLFVVGLVVAIRLILTA